MHWKVLPTGCTVTHTFTIPISREEISELYISYEQGNRVLVEKTVNDCSFDIDDEGEDIVYLVSTELSQQDTMKFDESRPYGATIKIQLRIKLINNAVIKSNVITLTADELIKKGEI